MEKPNTKDRIFINYRRGDDPGFAGRIFDYLRLHFSEEQLFMDVVCIPAGRDFVEELDNQIARCDLFLCIIGKDWLEASDETGKRRLDLEDDFVRIEIESALERDVKIIPVLVNQARMPTKASLPSSLKALARRNAVTINHERFHADCDGLVKSLKQVDQSHQASSQLPPKSSSIAAPGQTHSLSSQDISKAEELTNWGFIEKSKRSVDFIEHLERFPQGLCYQQAREKLEALRWDDLKSCADPLRFRDFSKEFPDGRYKRGADRALIRLERASWKEVKKKPTESKLLLFLEDFPDTQFATEARATLEAIKNPKVKKTTDNGSLSIRKLLQNNKLRAFVFAFAIGIVLLFASLAYRSVFINSVKLASARKYPSMFQPFVRIVTDGQIEEHSNLTSAMEFSKQGSLVEMTEGVYGVEPLTSYYISSRLKSNSSLKGAGPFRTSIVPRNENEAVSSAPIVNIANKRQIDISNLAIECGTPRFGIKISDSDEVLIDKVIVVGASHGIVVDSASSKIKLKNVALVNCVKSPFDLMIGSSGEIDNLYIISSGFYDLEDSFPSGWKVSNVYVFDSPEAQKNIPGAKSISSSMKWKLGILY